MKMSVKQPSQYDIDNMEPGDIVYIIPRSRLYQLYRKLFKKDLIKLKVKRTEKEQICIYDEYYQEDCILIYAYENMCIQTYKNEVPVAISSSIKCMPKKIVTLKELQVGLYNVTLVFPDNTTYIFPLEYIEKSIQRNQTILHQFDKQRLIKDALKFQKYDGDYFCKYARIHNIKVWNASYCSICGKPVKMHFKKDVVNIDNKCECGFNKLDIDKMSYNEFANWYSSQTEKVVKERFKEFWFKKE